MRLDFLKLSNGPILFLGRMFTKLELCISTIDGSGFLEVLAAKNPVKHEAGNGSRALEITKVPIEKSSFWNEKRYILSRVETP